MEINKNTKKCISIAERPGTFGVNFHNRGYEFLGINQIYIPLKVNSSQLETIIELVRENFYGCSVSMPHKETVIKYLDKLDSSAEKIGAVNTILNINGKLKGYNTDFYGAKKAISKHLNINGKKVLMLGAGGVARAIGYSVKDLGGELIISNRNNPKAKDLAKKLGAEYLKWEFRDEFYLGTLLINATSVGFSNPLEMPLKENSIEPYDAIMDAVIGETLLIKKAREQNQEIIPGTIMTIYQAEKQFEIYTGEKLPNAFINAALEEMPK